MIKFTKEERHRARVREKILEKISRYSLHLGENPLLRPRFVTEFISLPEFGTQLYYDTFDSALGFPRYFSLV